MKRDTFQPCLWSQEDKSICKTVDFLPWHLTEINWRKRKMTLNMKFQMFYTFKLKHTAIFL